MKKRFLGCKWALFLAVICFTISFCLPTVEASTVMVTVESNAGPWDPVLNSAYDYGVYDQASPTIITQDDGLSFAYGNSLTITYISGVVQAGRNWSWVDANGYTSYVANGNGGSSGNGFPSKYMSADWDTYLMALVGTFSDSSGIIVGNPFEIGTGPTTVSIPAGATQLQLGINDDIFHDNSGSFSVEVEGAPVPVPSALWLLGFGLIGLVGIRWKKG